VPTASHRSDRVAEAIREEVATFLTGGAKDPRIVGLITVTGVEVKRDLRRATIFVSVMGTDTERASTMAGLSSAAPYIRSRLGKTLRLYAAPEVDFKLDESIQRAARIDELLNQVRDGAIAPDDDNPGA
jgi:ribosome-binding factor A